MARLCHAKGVIHVLIRGDLPAKAARWRYPKALSSELTGRDNRYRKSRHLRESTCPWMR